MVWLVAFSASAGIGASTASAVTSVSFTMGPATSSSAGLAPSRPAQDRASSHTTHTVRARGAPGARRGRAALIAKALAFKYGAP
jgi:hypothetical protein